jgi:hypothetical protein
VSAPQLRPNPLSYQEQKEAVGEMQSFMFHYRSFRAQAAAVPALRIFADICGL